MTEHCMKCGRFVSPRDHDVDWSIEHGEFGVELSRTPIACRGCKKPEAKP